MISREKQIYPLTKQLMPQAFGYTSYNSSRCEPRTSMADGDG